MKTRPIYLLFLFFFTLILNPVSAQLLLKKISDLPPKMYETSGLVYYKNKYLLTHNDSGNKSDLFILDTLGNEIKTIDIKAKNHDWEDIATDPKGNVYIADIGNNNNDRDNLRILLLKNGFIKNKEVEPEVIKFEYEDQTHFPPKKEHLDYDAEGLIYKDGFLYVFTKCRSKPFTGFSFVYQIPAKAGEYKAKRIGLINLCSKGWHSCSVTSVDYFPKTKTLAILTYGRLYVFTDFNSYKFWEGKMKMYSISTTKQREGLAFKSANEWYMTDEYRKGLGGGNLYRVYLSPKTR